MKNKAIHLPSIFTIPSAALLLCLLICTKNTAQTKLAFDQLTIKDGLPSQVITEMIQDDLGFIWIANENGLTRYDGYAFKTYSYEPFASNKSLSEGHTQSLAIDKSGNILVGTVGGGLNVFNPATEIFEHFLHDNNNSNSISNDFVSDIAVDPKGGIWLATNNGLNYLSKDYKFFQHYLTNQNPFGADHLVKCVYADPKGNILAGAESGAIFIIKPGHNSIEIGERLFHNDRNPISCIVPAKTGGVWIGTQGGGIYLLDKNYNLIRRINTSSRPYISYNEVYSILEDNKGNIWVGSRNGLDVIDLNTQQTANYLNGKEQSGIAVDVIINIIQDRSGVIWVCSDGQGLYLARKKSFGGGIHTGQLVRDLYKDEDNSIWVACGGSGLLHIPNCCDEKINEIYSRSFRPETATRIVKDNYGYFWIGSKEDGLFRLKISPGGEIISEVHFNNKENGARYLPSNYVWSLFIDNRNWLWVGTKNGFSVLDLNEPAQNFSFIHFPYTPNNNEGLVSHEVRSFLIDSKNNMWLGTRGGVNRFRLPNTFKELTPAKIKMKQFRYDAQNPKSISSNSILTIIETKNREIWIATGSGGINRYLSDQKGFIHVTTKQGLPINEVYTLLEDDAGRLWMSTNYGISVYDRQKKQVTNFTLADGLHGYEYTGLACHRAFDGEFLFGGAVGFDRFYPEEVLSVKNGTPPLIAITDFIVFTSDSTDEFLQGKNIAYIEKITLPYRANFFDIKFAALDFNAPFKNSYQYILEGYDKDWISAHSAQRTATYTKVPPGRYTFKIKAANGDGVWAVAPKTLLIVIRPPWWRTNAAYAFYTLALLASAWGFYYYQRQRWHLQLALESEKKEAERLKELDAVKTRLYTNISHEFRTPLTVISGMADQIEKAPREWLHKGVKLIKRNSSNLLELVNQMLELRKLEAGTMKVKMVQGNVITYIRYISESFHSLSDTKGIDMLYSFSASEIRMDYDPEKLLRIISNLLINAIKFTPQNGQILLEVQELYNQHPTRLQIKISDTGVGISAEQLPHIFDHFYQADDSETRAAEGAGIGLTLTRELIKLLGGDITVESQLGEGTTFTVQLPIHRNAPLQDEVRVKTPVIMDPASPVDDPFTARHPDDHKHPMVLIVEDNLDVVLYLEACLSGAYRLIKAPDGEAGIAQAFKHIPDMIISDIMMPKKNGYEVCDTLKNDERTSHIPIVLLTAKADGESRIQGWERGADAYLTKPFNMEELAVQLRKLLEIRQKLQARYAGMTPLPPTDDIGLQIEDKFVQKARAIVEHFLGDENFDLRQLCKELAISRTQLHNKLKALTNRSTTEFINGIRLQKAKELLATTELNVSEVAYAVGFSDPNFFSRCYLKEFGVRPSGRKRR